MILLRFRHVQIALSLFLLAGLTLSCVKDEGEISGVSLSSQSEWGIPLATVRLESKRLIQHFDSESLLESDSEGFVSMVYMDSLAPINARDFLQLPDQHFQSSFQLNDQQFGSLISEQEFTLHEVRDFSFQSSEGDRLDSLRLAGGDIRLRIESSSGIPIHGFVAILDPEDQSQLLRIDYSDQEAPIFIDERIDAGDLLLRFNSNESGPNALLFEYEINFTYGGSGINSEVEVSFEAMDISLASAGGYIAPRSISLGDHGIGISLFDNVGDVGIRLEDPRFNFFFLNGFGLSSQLEVHELFGSNANGEMLVVPGEGIADFPVIEGAAAPGQPQASQVSIDNSLMTPNISDFMAFYPNFLSGDFSLHINPDDVDLSFISRESELQLAYEAEIPLFGSISDFSLVDTTGIELDEWIELAEENEAVQALGIRIIIDNGLPLDAELQLVFADSLFQVRDSVFQSGMGSVLASAPLELSLPLHHAQFGRAVGSTQTVLDVDIPRERLLDLEDVRYLLVKVEGHTTGNGSHPIRIYDNDFIQLRLGARIKLRHDV